MPCFDSRHSTTPIARVASRLEAAGFRRKAPSIIAAFVAGIALIGTVDSPRAATPTPALDALVQAERQFSATSVDKGMREAFLAFLDDQGVVFRPLPVNGKKMWQARGNSPGTLIWEPSFAEVSAAGDLGYTTGPWEFRPVGLPDKSATAFGHFISVWKHRPDGTWRVMADLGCQHEEPQRGVGSRDFTPGPTTRAVAKSAPAKSDDLANLDRALSETARVKGLAAAFSQHAAVDIRLNREGTMPVLGRSAAVAKLDSVSGAMRFVTQGSGIAASRDLGYTYGVALLHMNGAASAPADSGVYLHVWRRGADQRWKLALAVENPL